MAFFSACSVVMLVGLLLCVKSMTLQLGGTGYVLAPYDNGGVVVFKITAPDSRLSEVTSYPNLDGSLQSPAARGKDKHQFLVDDETVQCVASLKNASVGFLCEDGRVLGDVPYPSGCWGVYFQSLWQLLYVGFEQAGCSPLKIELTDDGVQPFRATQEYQEELAGKVVVVSRGQDFSGIDTIFYIYIDSGSHLVYKSADDGTEFRISSSEIESSCVTLTDLLHIPNPEHPTIDVVLNCADSAGASYRYMVRTYFGDIVDEVLAISDARGNLSASQDGRFLAVLVSRDSSHSIVLYNTSRIQSPIPVYYKGPVPHIKFLRAEDGHNYLAILREGNDVELVDLEHLFTHGSSTLKESKVQFPMTTVRSCTPTCPYSEIVSGNLFMVAVWNGQSLQYDLRAIQLSTGDTATIPSGSSTSPIFAFVQLQPVPVVTPSLTSSSTFSTPTTTPAVQPTPTELPSSLTATSSPSIAVYPSPSTSPPPGPQGVSHVNIGVGVGVGVCVGVGVSLLLVVLVCFLRRKRMVKTIEAVEESGMVPPVQEKDTSSLDSSSTAPV